ncbi:MAG: phosphatidate cytidylyltransferase [Bacteroidetes bacterium]|nr:phosphatidate cytidylyltransferase [Bacteroidota bacterium]
MSNMVVRILTALVLGPVVLAGIYLGGWFLLMITLLISVVSVWEFFMMAKVKSISPNFVAGLLLSVLFPVSFFAIDFPVSPAGLVVLSVFVISLAELFRDKANPVLNIGFTVFGSAYIGIGIGSFLGIRHMIPGEGADTPLAWLLLAVVFGIWMCDSFAYFGGKLLGRKKLFPRVSPNKTWEGALSGFVASLITVYLFSTLTPMEDLHLTLTEIVFLGIIPGLFGQLGDLTESLFKRDTGVKDSSHLIPGHGGMFDRFDSLILVAPIVFSYLKFIVFKG